MRPPLPILPRNLLGCAGTPFFGIESGGRIPAIANLSGSNGFVNNKTGSSGSCIVPYHKTHQPSHTEYEGKMKKKN
jgi:uncharacterized protein with NRDE domain